MTKKITYSRQIFNRIPLIGILCFVLLYVYSATLYPGGSQANPSTKGFDWINNYWCNLMSKKGVNGEPNPARPFSIVAIVVLCVSLLLFFIDFAKTYVKNTFWKKTIKVNGILSMSFAALIFTKHHDLMTILSSIFGAFVVIGIIKEIYTSKMLNYKISGFLCILILGFNNYIYYTKYCLEILPFLQKITLAVVLIWIIGLQLILIKINKN